MPTMPKKPLLITAAILALLLVVGQLVFDYYAYKSSVRPADNGVITNLLIKAVDGLLRPAVVEPVSGRVYLPEARLVLPPYSDSVRDLRYNYSSQAPQEIQVTTANAVNSAESRLWAVQTTTSSWRRPAPAKVFAEVPNLQACARGVHLLFDANSPAASGLASQGSTKLKDGRTLYIYKEHSACQPNDFSTLVAYLKQAQSY